jgi:cation:H+ antiporter
MLVAAATILVGFIILIWSADLFVDGAASIAENMGMSPIIIGMTIVSLGTSAPEVLVSINASLSGSGSLAIGNAIGSNIANIGMVLGATLLVAPLMVHSGCMKKEIPLLLLATAGVGALILDGYLSALDGWLMIGALGIILWRMVRSQISDTELTAEVVEEPLPHLKPLRRDGGQGTGGIRTGHRTDHCRHRYQPAGAGCHYRQRTAGPHGNCPG